MHSWSRRDDAQPVPERPRLKPWYRVAEAGEALVLEHGQSAIVFEGSAARRLLPELLPLLDGSRPVSDLMQQLGPGREAGVDHALRLLHEHALLLDGPGLHPDEPAGVVDAVESLASAAPGSQIAAIRRSLADAVVEVVGGGAAVPTLTELLRASGVGRIVGAPWETNAERSPTRLVLIVPSGSEVAEAVRWNSRAVEGGADWLQVLPFDGRFAAIGPLYIPCETCCFECYRLRRLGTSGYPAEFGSLEEAELEAPAGPALNATVAGVAATVVLRWLAHRDHLLPGAFYACEDGGTALTHHRVYRVPRCPVCSGLEGVAPPLPWYKETTAAEVVP